MTAAERWRADLESWRIPDAILSSVAESPWGFPAGLFELRAEQASGAPPSVSHLKSLAALAGAGSVLDVGCGGGAASLPLRPPARRVVGVDSAPTMLDGFSALAAELGVEAATVLGEWPGCSGEAEAADVTVCHHVVYNVADLVSFVTALTGHARRRVVVELTRVHPLSALNPLWLRFHGLARPTRPTVDDAVEVVRETGVEPNREDWEGPAFETAFYQSQPEAYTAWIRRRLCLPPERTGEVGAAIEEAGGPAAVSSTSGLTTLWWDV